MPHASACTIVMEAPSAPCVFLEPNTGESMKLGAVKIENYKALREASADDLTSLAAFVDTNGAGESSLLDALVFLHASVIGFASCRTSFRLRRDAVIVTLMRPGIRGASFISLFPI